MGRGKNAEALETFKSVLDGDKNNQLALFNMAVAQKNMSQYDDAIKTLKRYIKASPSKSEHTDQAFAMIDEMNATLSANNQKVSDEDLQSLAGELANRPISTKTGGSFQANETKNAGQAGATGKTTTVKKAEAAIHPENASDAAPTDSEIEALERQLKSPAH